MKHSTVRLISPWGEECDIDELMVPIIQALWAEGIQTSSCCQGIEQVGFLSGFGGKRVAIKVRAVMDSRGFPAWLDECHNGGQWVFCFRELNSYWH